MRFARRGAPQDRLSAMDATNLLVEARGVVMHVAALAMLDGRALLDDAGELRLDAVREYVGTRLPRRLRQRLVLPERGTRGAHWAAPGEVDLTRHVRVRALPAPADEAKLLEACARINERPLDRRFPLWEMWLLTGLPEQRVGMFLRLHHVIADGVAVLGMLESMFTEASGSVPAPVAPARTPAAPDRSALRWRTLAGGARTRALLAASGAAEAVDVLRAGRAPAVSLNRPVRGRSRVVLARADLARTKAVAHAHGGKVNDVVLAAVAGGARLLLERRGELTENLVLRVSVIASLRGIPGSDGDGVPGNLTGVRVVPVPVAEPDPVRRLELIAVHTAARRGRPPLRPGGRLLRRWMVGVMNHQRMVNLLVSNLPGPPSPLVFAGAPVLELFQLGTNQGNLALSVGVLSYAGALEIDVVGDVDVVPDLDVFVSGLTDTLEVLGAT